MNANSQRFRDALNEIRREIENDQFEWSTPLEDIHMNIEAKLTERIGETGKNCTPGAPDTKKIQL